MPPLEVRTVTGTPPPPTATSSFHESGSQVPDRPGLLPDTIWREHCRMWGRLLVFLFVVFGVWYYFNQKKAHEPKAAPAGTAAGDATASSGCSLFAERARAALVAAASIAATPPVEPSVWSRAESNASSAISAADSACAGSSDARLALSLMRLSLSEAASGARGEGGATGLAARQGDIDALLNRLRGR